MYVLNIEFIIIYYLLHRLRLLLIFILKTFKFKKEISIFRFMFYAEFSLLRIIKLIISHIVAKFSKLNLLQVIQYFIFFNMLFMVFSMSYFVFRYMYNLIQRIMFEDIRRYDC